jgi:hypothetical protein
MGHRAKIVIGLILDAILVVTFLTSPAPVAARAALTITPTTHATATHAGERFAYVVRVESMSPVPELARIDMDIPQTVGQADTASGRCVTLAFRTSCLLEISALTPRVIVVVASGRQCPASQWAHFHVKDERGNSAVQNIGLHSLDCGERK